MTPIRPAGGVSGAAPGGPDVAPYSSSVDNADPHRPFDPAGPRAFAAALARTLQQARCRHHLSPAEIAARTGGAVSESALIEYETGVQAPEVDVLWVLARALGEPVRALADEAGDRLDAGSGSGADRQLP
ncbi:helix-turn-helix domain-containing protein [Nakamurella sp.]|uniref:helix-turn-helix domain-containing protein n=1 Tax=Nakamurella sp. TaxID=1869182 RepID=UPI003B3B7015